MAQTASQLVTVLPNSSANSVFTFYNEPESPDTPTPDTPSTGTGTITGLARQFPGLGLVPVVDPQMIAVIILRVVHHQVHPFYNEPESPDTPTPDTPSTGTGTIKKVDADNPTVGVLDLEGDAGHGLVGARLQLPHSELNGVNGGLLGIWDLVSRRPSHELVL